MNIAISNWQGRVSPLFDVSDRLLRMEVQGRQELRREAILLTTRDPFARARQISDLGIDVLICGAISFTLETAIGSTGVRVVGFICGDVDAVASAFLDRRLTDSRFQMPGYRRKRLRGSVHTPQAVR
jgi:hypothetical protein